MVNIIYSWSNEHVKEKHLLICWKVYTFIQKPFVTRRIPLSVSQFTSNVYSHWPCSTSGVYEVKSVPYPYGTHSFHSRQNNKVLSQLSGVPVKTCLPSTRTAYSEMCPIKGPHDKHPQCRGAARRRRLHFKCL